MNMIYAMHIPKKERKRALWDVYAVEPVTLKFNPWSAYPITFDRKDHPTSIRHGGSAALVLDPIVDGYHLTRVLMDRGSSLNLIYPDTVKKMGIDPSRIKPSNTTFKGVILGRTVFAHFNAVPHYAYLKLKIPGPKGVITVNGNTERSLRTEEHTAALTAESQPGIMGPNYQPAVKAREANKWARVTSQFEEFPRA